MAIVSKTNRNGVDVALEAIQQSIYPRLLGYWDASSVYACYPRANKNHKDGQIYPEISLDEKDYKEVLFEDKVDVNSFFLVDNERDYNTSLGQSTHRVSLIFQADLVALYGQTVRADEKFNIDVLRVLKKQSFYINSDTINIIETPNNVYSELTLEPNTIDRLRINDLSKNHVVRFDFEITYKINCEPTTAPVCADVTINQNGVFQEFVPSGGVFNYASGGDPVTFSLFDVATGVDTPSGQNINLDIVDSGGGDIGTLTTNTANSKIASIGDALNTMNGASISGAFPEATKAFQIVDQDDNTLTVVTVTDTKALFKGEITLVGAPIPAPHRPPLLDQTVPVNDHDEKWHKDQGTFDFTYTSSHKVQMVDPDNTEKVLFDDSSVTGLTHLFRFVGYKGGYYDPSDGFFYNKDGVLSDYDTEFKISTGGNDYYAIDRWTWLGWRLRRGGSANLASQLAALPFSDFGFSDFWMPTEQIDRTITDKKDNDEVLYFANRPPFDITLNTWLCTYYANSSTEAWFSDPGGQHDNAAVSGSRAVRYVRVHNWGVDDSI